MHGYADVTAGLEGTDVGPARPSRVAENNPWRCGRPAVQLDEIVIAQPSHGIAIWLAILILTGAFTAMLAAALFHFTGAGPREVMAAAASAFGGVVTLGLAGWRALAG